MSNEFALAKGRAFWEHNYYVTTKPTTGEKVSTLIKDLNGMTMTCNRKLEIITEFPSLLQFFSEENWNLSIVNHVVNYAPEYFIYIPEKFLTKEMYKSYLMKGAKELRTRFKPVICRKLLDVDIAIFLLRTCHVPLSDFKDDKKYITHLLKTYEKNKYVISHWKASGLFDRVSKNPEKYLGIGRTALDDVIAKYTFSDAYDNIDHELADDIIFLCGDESREMLIKEDFMNYAKHLVTRIKKYPSTKESAIAEWFKYFPFAHIDTYPDLFDDRFRHCWFGRLMLEEFLSVEVVSKDGKKYTVKHRQWLLKTLSNFFKGK